MSDKSSKYLYRPILLIGFAILIIGTLLALLVKKDSNPDFGNVPAVAGYGLWEPITDCAGDTDLLTIDAIDWSRSTDGTIAVRTTPSGVMSFTSQPLDSEGFATGDSDERGRYGYAEKKTGRKWEYVGEICVDFVAYAGYGFGDSQTPDAFFSFVRSDEGHWTWQELKIQMPEYEPGATYRINYFFRSQEDNGWSNEVHTVAHTVTLPERSDKRLDFISLGWTSAAGTSIKPEVRVNYGGVPYLLLDACKLEYKENNRWAEFLPNGESVFESSSGSPIAKLTPCQRAQNHYYIFPNFWYSAINPNIQNYRLTLVFCDNADGSGKRYTLTLYLNTELLAEYR